MEEMMERIESWTGRIVLHIGWGLWPRGGMKVKCARPRVAALQEVSCTAPPAPLHTQKLTAEEDGWQQPGDLILPEEPPVPSIHSSNRDASLWPVLFAVTPTSPSCLPGTVHTFPRRDRDGANGLSRIRAANPTTTHTHPAVRRSGSGVPTPVTVGASVRTKTSPHKLLYSLFSISSFVERWTALRCLFVGTGKQSSARLYPVLA